MNENILRALMQLSALVAQINQSHFHKNAHSLIKTYLEQTTGRNNFRTYIKQYLTYFNEYTSFQNISKTSSELNKEKLVEICHSLTSELTINDRFILILSFLELINLDNIITPAEEEFSKILAETLKLNNSDFTRVYDFIINTHPKNINNQNYLLISDAEVELAEELEGSWILKNKPGVTSYHTINKQNFNGKIYILKIDQTDQFVFKYIGRDMVKLSMNSVAQNKFYILNPQDSISIDNASPIYYYTVNEIFKSESSNKRLVFTGKDILLLPSKTNSKDTKPFSFSEESGNIVCINGKNTITELLLRSLSGNSKIISGKIELNGYNLHKELYRLNKFIGYIPSSPIYSEHLSVFENISYAARIAFPAFNKSKINDIVEEVLNICYLTDLKNEIPASSAKIQNEFLYQKLIQLAFIMVKDPYIAFIHNIFDNLNIADTSLIFNILRYFSSKGRIIFVSTDTINSTIINNVNKIWIFDDYKIIFNGNTHEVITYFNKFPLPKVDAELLCTKCNKFHPETILQIINQKVIDESGNLKTERKITSDEWYKLYKENIENKIAIKDFKKILPIHNSTIPNINKQYQQFLVTIISVFFRRIKENAINFFVFSFTGLFLGFLFRNDWTHNYKYGLNPNIHLYLLVSVLFLFIVGFLLAEKEIQLNKRLNNNEANKNLSFISLINAQCTYLFALTMLYCIIFTISGYFILELVGAFYKYFIIFFSVISLGVILGMLLSNIFSKRTSVYFAFIGIVTFFTFFNGFTIHSVHFPNSIATEKFTPVISDLSPMRWALEAIIVDQTINNQYQSNFFELDKKIEKSSFLANHFIPEVQKTLLQIKSDLSNRYNQKILESIKKEIENFPKTDTDLFPFEYVNSLIPSKIDEEIINETIDYLRYAQIFFSDQIRITTDKKHDLENQLAEKIGINNLKELKLKCINSYINELINSFKGREGIKFYKGSIIKLFNPLYSSPESNFGRAPMFVPEKLFNGYYYDTFWFNLFIIWMFVILFYLTAIACCFKF
jgi:ABC-type multidrug transport system ATPase subunit